MRSRNSRSIFGRARDARRSRLRASSENYADLSQSWERSPPRHYLNDRFEGGMANVAAAVGESASGPDRYLTGASQ
jgi:hypothetical protein